MINFALVAWLVANLLHPLVMKAYEGGDDWFGNMPGLFLIVLPFSIPSLILSILSLRLIKKVKSSILLRYILWLICIPLIVWLNMQFFIFFITGGLFFDTGLGGFVVPPAIAAVIASFILGPYFFKQMNEVDIFRKGEDLL